MLYTLVKEALVSDSPMTLQVVRLVAGPCLMSHSPALPRISAKSEFSCIFFPYLSFCACVAASRAFTVACAAAKHHFDLGLLSPPFMALFYLAEPNIEFIPAFPALLNFAPL